MFPRKRNKHESAPGSGETPLISPLTDREANILPGHEDDPEQPTRILSHYVVEDLGSDYLATELIWAQTVTDKPKPIKVEDINEMLLFMGLQVEKVMNATLSKAGRYIIEYPRETEEESTKGLVFVLGAQMMRYSFEERGDVITVTGSEAVTSAGDRLVLPVGTRVTADVKMIEAGDTMTPEDLLESVSPDYVVNATEPTAEEDFTTRIRDAIVRYNTQPKDSMPSV